MDAIEQFTKSSRAKLMLISTKAGNMGINLVAANRVIIMDVSWNPSDDFQALSRCFRLGQQKPVYVYRLVLDNSLESKVYTRQVIKTGLANRVIDDQGSKRHFNAQDSLCTTEGIAASNGMGGAMHGSDSLSAIELLGGIEVGITDSVIDLSNDDQMDVEGGGVGVRADGGAGAATGLTAPVGSTVGGAAADLATESTEDTSGSGSGSSSGSEPPVDVVLKQIQATKQGRDWIRAIIPHESLLEHDITDTVTEAEAKDAMR
jgi:hypothetical protein